MSFDLTGFDFGTAGAPTLSGGGKTDILMFECRTDGGKLMYLGCAKGFAWWSSERLKTTIVLTRFVRLCSLGQQTSQ